MARWFVWGLRPGCVPFGFSCLGAEALRGTFLQTVRLHEAQKLMVQEGDLMSRQVKIAGPTGSPFAVAVMFFGNGLVMASSFSRMPGIRDQVDAIPTQLAFALVCVG